MAKQRRTGLTVSLVGLHRVLRRPRRFLLIASLALVALLVVPRLAWADEPTPSPTASEVTPSSEPSPSSSPSSSSPETSESGSPSPEPSASPGPSATAEAETPTGHVWTDDEAAALLGGLCLLILLGSVHVIASLGR